MAEETDTYEMNRDMRNMRIIETIHAELAAQKALYYMTTTREARQETATARQTILRRETKPLFVNRRQIKKNCAVVLALLEREKDRDRHMVGVWNLTKFCASQGYHYRGHEATERALCKEAGLSYDK